MKKRILIILCAILIVFSQVACTDEISTGGESKSAVSAASTASVSSQINKPKDERMSAPCLWKVTGNGYDGEFYLLGSIHVGDENTNYYPDELLAAYNSCEYLAVESDVIALESNLLMMSQALRTFLYTDGTAVYNHIDSTVYSKAREVLTDSGMYSQTYDFLMPIYWMMTIENILVDNTSYTVDNSVDRYFLTDAKSNNKTILEIEDVLETYQALADLSAKTQEILLEQVIEQVYTTEYSDSLDGLYSVWKAGDVATASELILDDSTEGMSEEEIAAYTEYNNMLMTTRNKNMVDVAASYLESDMDVFYVVGLAHMFGDDGIVNGLNSMGYTVTLVQYSF